MNSAQSRFINLIIELKLKSVLKICAPNAMVTFENLYWVWKYFFIDLVLRKAILQCEHLRLKLQQSVQSKWPKCKQYLLHSFGILKISDEKHMLLMLAELERPRKSKQTRESYYNKWFSDKQQQKYMCSTGNICTLCQSR